MASKGPRSKLDHETRAKRQKALEVSREPPRPKAHWDHVLEEMVWLSKDFESERKWKLAQAKKVAIRASKSILDQATRGEKKVKEEEQRIRKVALNISKDVKKFWMKVEKLVLYKHQLEVEERKKKALDKQLDFLLGQTERYSTMLAENLVDMPNPCKNLRVEDQKEQASMLTVGEDQASLIPGRTDNPGIQVDGMETDDKYGVQSADDVELEEHTPRESEALILEAQQIEDVSTLQNESDLPLQKLLKQYMKTAISVSREVSSVNGEDFAEPVMKRKDQIKGEISFLTDFCNKVNGSNHINTSSNATHLLDGGEENHSLDKLMQNRWQACDSSHNHHVESNGNRSFVESQLTIQASQSEFPPNSPCTPDEEEYMPVGSADELDDETTLSEEEMVAKNEKIDSLDEIAHLQKESEMPIEELLARYKKAEDNDDDGVESEYSSSSSDEQAECASHGDIELGSPHVSPDECSLELGKLSEGKEPDSAMRNEAEHEKLLDQRDGEDIIADAAAAARSAQPTGNTFSTTKVRTKFPFLLKHPLREYQHIGLDWLVTMYEQRLNGILADEMGLGKTIMTIALLAHLACEKGIWGPHLIVVPTSVMLNWETEFLKWCPAFKILTYFGSAKERKQKRQGWMKPNSFHMCITTYRLVIQDSKVFKRKKWKYLILDEAHLIKNWKSQRWQTLLNFNSKRRILLTGTPLQNDLMELWSLMHFLMPHIFQSHQEFKDWFSNPISGMVEGQEKVNKEVVDRLHNVLRPFILRRLKRDVEKQLPRKFEHVIYCRLSRRQRNLYEDFIASSETQATLASANYFGMISVIMQLRKVCNHPDLFEGRPIISSFDMEGIDMQLSSSICTVLCSGPFSKVDLGGLNFLFTQNDFGMTSWEIDEVATLSCSSTSIIDLGLELSCFHRQNDRKRSQGTNIFEEIQKALWVDRVKQSKERLASIAWWNALRCQKKPLYGTNLLELVTIKHQVYDINEQKINPSSFLNYSSQLADIILSPVERLQMLLNLVECFMFAIPAARAPPPDCWCSKGKAPVFLQPAYKERCTKMFGPLLKPIRPCIVRRQLYFPDRRLIQFDCGKLQELAILLRRLKSEGHRALIFTQMTKMLDVLEAFINLYGYTYMRLDGSTQPEERQTLMQRFNTNPKFFLFILSTRSGGVGINLVGADTVIFYDSDWNPAMDQQAQDRCHRIGQTREVHIYRLISKSTIEENILKKANQKRVLDDLVIQSGSYNTEFFKKLDPLELFSDHRQLHIEDLQKGSSNTVDSAVEVDLSNADVEAAIKHAEDEADYMALKRVEQEEAVENQEFTEDAIGRLEDEELCIEDDVKNDEKVYEEQNICGSMANKVNDVVVHENEENAITLAEGDEDIDMLADVKQMAAAAAAAGHASSSFENQLRPIDRYAMRFLDLWDPIIDKSKIEFQVNVEEEEWELDRIEKFKEDLEAEIDEDQEPFLYERWDAEFATTAYRQHVEALAQRQLMEELESEAQAANDGEDFEITRSEAIVERKPKLNRKLKKTKFKSLKKGSLGTEADFVQGEPPRNSMPFDSKVLSPDTIHGESEPSSPRKNKRKKAITYLEEETNSRTCLKKQKKAPTRGPIVGSNSSVKLLVESRDLIYGEIANDIDLKQASRSKAGVKISIPMVPVKRVMVIKPEKLKKRGHVWSRDCFPSPDVWSSQEDAMLCASIHEYGTNWRFISDILYSMSGGGFCRGRYRHPVHCCERFRELFLKYVMSTVDSTNAEKVSSSGSGKALLKVTEDHVRTLLNVVTELPDNELLLQKHFIALLSSVWKAKWRNERWQSSISSQVVCSNTFSTHSSGRKISKLTDKLDLTILRQSGKLLAAALTDVDTNHREKPVVLSTELEASQEAEQLDLDLEFPADQCGSEVIFPLVINVSVRGQVPPQSPNECHGSMLLAESSYRIAENRFRRASETCYDGEGRGWASSAFPTSDVIRCRSGSKSQILGKHKSVVDSVKPPKSKVPRITEPNEEFIPSPKGLLPSPRTTPTDIVEWHTFHVNPGDDEHAQYLAMDELYKETVIEHEYDPDLLADLKDLGSMEDLFDIG